MLRKLIVGMTVLLLASAAWAQLVINPTTTSNEDQLVAVNGTEASVEQEIKLNLPLMTALHLDASTLTFDLGADDWGNTLTCAYVSGADVVGGGFYDQTQVVPGGIAYARTAWNQIKLIYHGNGRSGDVPAAARATTYAPGVLTNGATGDLVAGSKDHFVCFQTFVLQLFSNAYDWELMVERDDDQGAQGIEHLYIQGNTCSSAISAATGLYDLPNDSVRNLIPESLTGGPTGDWVTQAGSSCRQTSSWLDILGVIAVKVNSDLFGESTANLTYTLVSDITQ